MIDYLIPIASLLLTFLAFFASLRFLFSRQGTYYIIPVLISLLLSLNNAFYLFYPNLFSNELGLVYTFYPLAISFLWYMMIITFHYAIKKNVVKNKYLDEMNKNLAEAKIIEKMERRNKEKDYSKQKERSAYKATVPQVYQDKDTSWVDLFN